MSAWQRALDEMKRQAAEMTSAVDQDSETHKTAARLVAEGLASEQDLLNKARAAAKDLPVEEVVALVPVMRIVSGWQIGLSRRRGRDGFLWHMSALLWPKGRGSNDSDWSMLGRIAAHVGAPETPTLVPDDPGHAHHWSWMEASS